MRWRRHGCWCWCWFASSPSACGTEATLPQSRLCSWTSAPPPIPIPTVTYGGVSSDEPPSVSLKQAGAVDSLTGALTASIMHERVAQHDLMAVVPFVTREAEAAVTPR